MKRKIQGYMTPESVAGERYQAYVPHSLPPKPALRLDGELQELAEHSLLAVGRLDSLTTLLPDTSLFIYMYVRKEAVLSSQIEGTQSSLSDLLLFESDQAPGVPVDDVQEVSNYVAALNYGLQRIREGLPLSLRLIKEVHGVLLTKGRGSEKSPGAFRTSQNWIGGSRPGNAAFVPPPPNMVLQCMGDLEKFLHDQPNWTPLLVKAALTHVQFETIHPFLDGNGRLGRLLITLLLWSEGALKEPLLYLSLYFKSHRQEYYELLQSVRMDGDWERWLKFFMTGMLETAENAVATATRLVDLFKADKEKITNRLDRRASSALRVHDALQQFPLGSIPALAERSGLSQPAVAKVLGLLEEAGIVTEITGGQYAKKYSYTNYINILSEGTGPI